MNHRPSQAFLWLFNNLTFDLFFFFSHFALIWTVYDLIFLCKILTWNQRWIPQHQIHITDIISRAAVFSPQEHQITSLLLTPQVNWHDYTRIQITNTYSWQEIHEISPKQTKETSPNSLFSKCNIIPWDIIVYLSSVLCKPLWAAFIWICTLIKTFISRSVT